jgi:hypothetical protein
MPVGLALGAQALGAQALGGLALGAQAGDSGHRRRGSLGEGAERIAAILRR